MWHVMLLIAFLAIAFALYHLLPFLIVQFSRSLRSIRFTASNNHNSRFRSIIGRLVHVSNIDRIGHYLQNAGDYRTDAVSRHIKNMILWVGVPILAAILMRRPLYQAILVAVLGIALINGRISSRIRERQKALECSFYKVYRFIDSQMSAGVKATDVIKGLHESTDDPLIKPALIRFAARYSLTLDLDQAIADLRQFHSGKDIETLGTQLRQVLATGTAGRSFQRTEDLLFSRYFYLLQKQTVAIRNRLLISAILMMIPTLLLFLMPMFYEAITSLNTIFG